MENSWHSDQENNIRLDVKADPCPWCGSDSIVVDSKIIDFEVYGENKSELYKLK